MFCVLAFGCWPHLDVKFSLLSWFWINQNSITRVVMLLYRNITNRISRKLPIIQPPNKKTGMSSGRGGPNLDDMTIEQFCELQTQLCWIEYFSWLRTFIIETTNAKIQASWSYFILGFACLPTKKSENNKLIPKNSLLLLQLCLCVTCPSTWFDRLCQISVEKW